MQPSEHSLQLMPTLAAQMPAFTVCAATLLVIPLVAALPQAFPQILMQGRFGEDAEQSYASVDDLPITFSWPSSSIFVSFNSSSVNVTLTALPSTVSFSGYNTFVFQLDQEVPATETQDLNSTVINWSVSGLDSGTHNLTITKLNEAMYGEATLDAITLGRGGRQACLPVALATSVLCIAFGLYTLYCRLTCSNPTGFASLPAGISSRYAYAVQVCQACHACGAPDRTSHAVHWYELVLCQKVLLKIALFDDTPCMCLTHWQAPEE